MTESGSAGGQWPWGWGQPGLGAVRLGCGLETGRGLGAGRGSLHPGGRPSWVKTSQESKKPGGHSCSLRFSPAKGLRPRGIGRSSGHSPCSLGSSSFPEKHLMPLKSREQSHQGVPRSPLCPAKSPQNEKEAQGSEHTFTSTGGEGKWGLGYLAKSGWYPPRESLPGMQPCRPSGMGGLYPFKVVSCDVLRAEIPPGGHIPPPTCQGPRNRLGPVPTPRAGLAPEGDTPLPELPWPGARQLGTPQSPAKSREQASLMFTPPCLPFPANPRTGRGRRLPSVLSSAPCTHPVPGS